MKLFVKITSILLVFLSFIFVIPEHITAASVTTLTTNSDSIGQYHKFEATFQISQTFTPSTLLPYYYYDAEDTPENNPGKSSPYGVDGITIDAYFVSPKGVNLLVPAFYNQEYTRSKDSGGNEIMTPSSNYSWKLRFTPEETGIYKYYFKIINKDGTVRYPESGNLDLKVSASDSPGFIRQSPRDPRFMEFSNGTTYLPIGSGHQWWKCCGPRSYDYESTFSLFNQYGINLTRIWTQNDGYGLTIEGHFDAYKYPDDFNPVDRGVDVNSLIKGTQINQRGASELDKIVESAEMNGVYLELSSHEDPYWIWDASTQNEIWNPNPVTLDNPEHINYWKRNFRYRVARWGYSTSILSWEAWNEHGNIPSGSEVDNFYKTYGLYQTQTDPYKHLRTTSQGSQAWSPAFWSSESQDLANYHDYLMSSRYPAGLYDDEVNFVYRGAQCLRVVNPKSPDCYMGDGSSWVGSTKPIIWGELDTGSSSWNTPNPSPRADHNMIWAGLFSPLGGSGIDWFWDSKTYLLEKYKSAFIARKFFDGIDYIGSKFTYLATADVRVNSQLLTTDNEKLRALSLRSSSNKEAYLWVQNKDYTWGKESTVPAKISGNVLVPGLTAGDYNITYWDTHSGSLSSGGTVTQVSGNFSVPIKDLDSDIAIKVVSATLPSPSPTTVISAVPTLIPSPTTIPSIIGSGDTNNDTKVDLTDISNLIKNWVTSTLKGFDQYLDGKINAFDFAVVRNSFLALNITPSPAQPTSQPIPPASADEWTQFGHDAKHTNYTAQTVATPWQYKWQWNGADGSGKPQANHLSVPDLVQPITGGGKVYMVTTTGIYALDQNSGNVAWSNTSLGTLSGTAAYDPGGFVYVGSGNGKLYKLISANGTIAATYSATSALNLAPTLVGSNIYIVASDGTLTNVSTTNMVKVWSYSGGSAGSTPAAFSSGKNLLVYLTQDLYVHAVNANDGSRKWRVKPTQRGYQSGTPTASGAQAEEGWPVIAESHGIVFIRYRLDWDTLWTWNPYPTTNSSIRANLQSQSGVQALFALNIDNGSPSFVPAVGNGGKGDGGFLPMGPQPVIANINGQEVAYTIWRNGLTCAGISFCDGREDGVLGEMELDGSTVPGYTAGDMRFVGNGKYIDGQTDIQTDEMMQLTMSGNVLFHNHWLLSQSNKITDRSASYGDSFLNPIATSPVYDVIWRQASGQDCTYDAAHRYCANHLYSYGDSRYYASPGFYEYFDAQQGGSTPYTIVSGNLVLVKTADGAIIALGNGNPTASTGRVNFILSLLSKAESYLGKGIKTLRSSTTVAAVTPQVIPYTEAINNIEKTVTVRGTVASSVDHLPKAIYLGFKDPHDGALLLRIFAKDLSKFNYDPLTLLNKKIEVTGKVTLYWPESVDPEITVSDPSQIHILDN